MKEETDEGEKQDIAPANLSLSKEIGELLHAARKDGKHILIETYRSVRYCGTTRLRIEPQSVLRLPAECTDYLQRMRPIGDSSPEGAAVSSTEKSLLGPALRLDNEDDAQLSKILKGIRLNKATPMALKGNESPGCTGGLQVSVRILSGGREFQLSPKSEGGTERSWSSYSCGADSSGNLDFNSATDAIAGIKRLGRRAQAKAKFGKEGLPAAKKALAEATAQVNALAANLDCDTATQCRSDRWGICEDSLALSSTKVLAADKIGERFTKVREAQGDVDALENSGPRACPAIAHNPTIPLCKSGTCVLE